MSMRDGWYKPPTLESPGDDQADKVGRESTDHREEGKETHAEEKNTAMPFFRLIVSMYQEGGIFSELTNPNKSPPRPPRSRNPPNCVLTSS